jgi:hypothetical protein
VGLVLSVARRWCFPLAGSPSEIAFLPGVILGTSRAWRSLNPARTSQKRTVRPEWVSMFLPAVFSRRVPAHVVLLLGCVPALLLGCVNLKKPKTVEECAKAPGGCTAGWVPSNADGGKDVAEPAGPDLAPADEPVPPRKDAGPDVSTGISDVPADGADGGSNSGDAADVGLPSDVIPPADVVSPLDGKRDLPADKGTESEASGGPEPGPEPGREPAPEMGPEPGKEPGPEPGPEPRREPGPEPVPEPPPDASPDTSSAACANATPVTNGRITLGTKASFCFVTCDGMEYGWGCSSFTENDRLVKVNGTAVTCGGALPPKKSGYYYFDIAAGGNTWDEIHWSGTMATSCPKPPGGFSP